MQSLRAALALAGIAAAAISQSPLTTTFANNGAGGIGGGIYFDLTVQGATITIHSIDLNLNSPAHTVGTIDILSRPGGRVGFQTNAAAWNGPNAFGSPATSSGPGLPTSVTLSAPIPLVVGVHGIAIRANGLVHAFTNGNGANQTASTIELTLTAGEHSNVAFTPPLFTPRVVNCSIHYSVGGTGTLATAVPYGQGCIRSFSSFYESFAQATAFDLSNSSMSMLFSGTGYVMLPGIRPFVNHVNPQILALTDDSEVTVPLPGPQTIPGGTTNSLTICSNGFVSVAPGNGVGFNPLFTTFLNAPQTCWRCWHDFNPAAGGLMQFEIIGGFAIVTWNGVPSFGSTGPGSTFQMQFEPLGSVHFVWQTMSGTGNGYLVGYSPGGASLDPGNIDLSATLPNAFTSSLVDIPPLTLSAVTRPIINNPLILNTTNIGPTAAFGAVALGFQNPNAPIPMATGCTQYSNWLATLPVFFPAGAASVTTTFTTPNLVGLHMLAQSLVYDPAGRLTQLGAVASNGLDLGVGTF